jgi:hypothetical protein
MLALRIIILILVMQFPSPSSHADEEAISESDIVGTWCITSHATNTVKSYTFTNQHTVSNAFYYLDTLRLKFAFALQATWSLNKNILQTNWSSSGNSQVFFWHLTWTSDHRDLLSDRRLYCRCDEGPVDCDRK